MCIVSRCVICTLCRAILYLHCVILYYICMCQVILYYSVSQRASCYTILYVSIDHMCSVPCTIIMYSAVTLYCRLLCVVCHYIPYVLCVDVTLHYVHSVSLDSVGGRELRVGSNMILFLYILLLLMWHMYLFWCCILYIVSCHNYM